MPLHLGKVDFKVAVRLASQHVNSDSADGSGVENPEPPEHQPSLALKRRAQALDQRLYRRLRGRGREMCRFRPPVA